MDLKNLITALEEQNISIAELSRITGVPKSTLSSCLKGRSPNLEQLNLVAEFLNESIDYIAFNRKDKAQDFLIYRTIIENGSYENIIKKIN